MEDRVGSFIRKESGEIVPNREDEAMRARLETEEPEVPAADGTHSPATR